MFANEHFSFKDGPKPDFWVHLCQALHVRLIILLIIKITIILILTLLAKMNKKMKDSKKIEYSIL